MFVTPCERTKGIWGLEETTKERWTMFNFHWSSTEARITRIRWHILQCNEWRLWREIKFETAPALFCNASFSFATIQSSQILRTLYWSYESTSFSEQPKHGSKIKRDSWWRSIEKSWILFPLFGDIMFVSYFNLQNLYLPKCFFA